MTSTNSPPPTTVANTPDQAAAFQHPRPKGSIGIAENRASLTRRQSFGISGNTLNTRKRARPRIVYREAIGPGSHEQKVVTPVQQGSQPVCGDRGFAGRIVLVIGKGLGRRVEPRQTIVLTCDPQGPIRICKQRSQRLIVQGRSIQGGSRHIVLDLRTVLIHGIQTIGVCSHPDATVWGLRQGENVERRGRRGTQLAQSPAIGIHPPEPLARAKPDATVLALHHRAHGTQRVDHWNRGRYQMVGHAIQPKHLTAGIGYPKPPVLVQQQRRNAVADSFPGPCTLAADTFESVQQRVVPAQSRIAGSNPK